MELCPPLLLSVVAIEKEAFGSPLTKMANFTYLLSLVTWNHIVTCKKNKKHSNNKKLMLALNNPAKVDLLKNQLTTGLAPSDL